MSEPPIEGVVPTAQQAQVEITSRLVLATGFFPNGVADPETHEIMDLDEAAWVAFQQAPPGQKYLAEDGTLTVVPPPPPPIRKAAAVVVDQEVRTTDDVPVEAFRFTTKPKHVYRATFSMTAIDAVNGTTKDNEVRMTFKATASVLAQVGATAVLYNAPDTGSGAWAVQASAQFPDLVISVKGALGRTIDWLLTGEVGVYAPEGLEA